MSRLKSRIQKLEKALQIGQDKGPFLVLDPLDLFLSEEQILELGISVEEYKKWVDACIEKYEQENADAEIRIINITLEDPGLDPDLLED